MNSHPNLGTFWKGRVLLSFESFPCENPKLESEPLSEDIVKDFKKDENINWTICCELFFGINFPNKDEKYSIQIRWADQELDFDSKVLLKIC